MSNRGTYTAIQDWMLELDLDVWETIAYAVIFGFSQDGESTFTGSLAYLSRKMMCSRAKTISALKHLVELGMVQKICIVRNGVKFCEYRAYLPETGGMPEKPGSASQIPVGGIPGSPNNISSENIEETTGIYTYSASRGFVPPSVEDVRAYCEERRNGISAQQFVDYYTANGWMVGKSKMKDWRAAVRNWETRRRDNPAPQAPRPAERRYLSPEERTLRALAQLQARDGQLNTFAPDEQ